MTPDGAGLEEAITRLRERGYLSHALTRRRRPAPWAERARRLRVPAQCGRPLAGPHRRPLPAAARPAERRRADGPGRVARRRGRRRRAVRGRRRAASPHSAFPPASWSACGSARRRVRRRMPRRRVPGARPLRLDRGAVGGRALDARRCDPAAPEPIDSDASRPRDPENVTEVRPETAEEVVAPDAAERDTVNDDPPDEAPPISPGCGRPSAWPASSSSP